MGFFSDITGGSVLNGLVSLGSQWMANRSAKKQLAKEQEFNARQAALNRNFQTSEREAAQDYNTMEREASQAYNTSEREAAQDWNLEMWNLENEYNDPRAQMKRMVDAGINPNAVASGMAGNGSTAGSVAGSSGASSSPGSVQGQSGSVATTPSIAGFVGQNLASSVNTMWQNLAMQKEVAGKQLDNEGKQKELGIFDEQWQMTKQEIGSRIAASIADAKDKEAAKDLKVQQFEFLKDMNPVQLQTANMMYLKTKSEVEHIDQQIENLKKQYSLTDEQIKESQKRQENIGADTELKGAQTDVANASVSNINADTELKGAQTDLTESDKALRDVQKLIADKEDVIKGLESAAAEQGISFTGPDFWNAYNYEHVTGKKFGDLTKPYRKEERRKVWRNAAANMTENAVGSLVNAGASWISNPLGMSGAFGSRGIGYWNPTPRSGSIQEKIDDMHKGNYKDTPYKEYYH